MEKNISLSIVTAILLATNSYAQTNEDLGMITVSSATKSEQSIKDITSNVEVITGAELEEKHIATLSDALNLVSGMSFTQNGGLGKSTSMNLRGFDSKRVLVLIDGVRYNDPTSLSGALFENIILNNVQQIEVIKGAGSGIWGSEASAGVINIITKKPKEGTNGTISAEAGSFNTQKYGASVSHSTDKYYGQISYNKLTTDGFTAYAKNGVDIDNYEDDGYKNTTKNFKGGYTIDDENKIDFSHTTIDTYNEYDNASSDNLTSTTTSKNNLTGINFKNNTEITTTDLSYAKATFKRDYSSGSKYDGDIDEFGVKSKINYLEKSSFVVIGADYKSFKEEDVINKKYINKGFFVTNSNNFNEKTIVSESVRVDKYDAFEDKNTGKVGVKHNFTKDFHLSSNGGTAYNVPTLFNLYSSSYGNPNLKPETTKSFDFTVGYKELKATYFYNKITDMIDYDLTISKYGNLSGVSKLKGYEVDFKHNISDDALLSLNYTTLSAKNDDGKDLKRKAKENLKFGIDYYLTNKLTFGLNGEYVGERYDKDDHQGTQTGKYTLANGNINYTLSKMFSTYLKIENITNKYYQTVDNYATTPRGYYLGMKALF